MSDEPHFFTHGQNTIIAFDYLCKKEKNITKIIIYRKNIISERRY